MPGGEPQEEYAMSTVSILPAEAGDDESLLAPAKAARLLGALGDGLVELRTAELDGPACRRVAAAYRALLIEVASTMPDPLIAELVALGMRPLAPGAGVDDIRLAYAQLAGWLSGSLRYLNYAAALPISAARSTSRLA
jgi:hypothetical protein